jgi:tetratricopeptide (TPR) repeat protein
MLTRMGGASRELSVAVSVEASVTSSLMTAPARRLLSLLGVLPDGIARDDLTELLPSEGLAAAAVLRQLGLAFGEADRLRTLAPVREHVAATHPPEPADLDRAVSHYAQLAATTGNQVGTSEGARAAVRLQAETGNIAAMLARAATGGRTDELADAMDGLAEYWRFTGFPLPGLVKITEQAIGAHGITFQQAKTSVIHGDLLFQRSDHDGARAQFEQALRLFQRLGSVLGEANCIKGLGDIALDCSDHDGARAHYEQALPLYQSIPEQYSSGWTLVRLARLDSADSERSRHWRAAREAWASIGREDLIEGIQAEFE